MTRASLVVCASACLVGLAAIPARAQDAEPKGRFEIAVGPRLTGPTPFGVGRATETGLTSGPGGFLLFSTTSRLTSETGLDVRVDIGLSSSLQAEASASYGRPELSVAIGGDSEGGSDTVAREMLQRVGVEGGIVWRLPRLRLGSASPFVSAGAGYLRELHESGTLVSDGQSAHVGAGIRLPLVSRQTGLKSAGLRLEGLLTLRRRGAAPDSQVHTAPAGVVSMFVRF